MTNDIIIAAIQAAAATPILVWAFIAVTHIDKGGWFPLRLAVILAGTGAASLIVEAIMDDTLLARVGGASLALAIVIFGWAMRGHKQAVLEVFNGHL